MFKHIWHQPQPIDPNLWLHSLPINNINKLINFLFFCIVLLFFSIQRIACARDIFKINKRLNEFLNYAKLIWTFLTAIKVKQRINRAHKKQTIRNKNEDFIIVAILIRSLKFSNWNPTWKTITKSIRNPLI